MNDRIPHTESDLVLVDVKAKPPGWPPASLDTGLRASSPGNQREAGQQPKQQISNLYGFRGLPLLTRSAGKTSDGS
jgi:hypothetical protein